MSVKQIQDMYRLSPVQQGMLFHSLYESESDVYFEQFSWTVYGDLDVSAYERAWELAFERHPVLRTAFFWEALDEPLQVVYRRARMPIVHHDWRDLPPDEQAARLEELLVADRRRGFALSDPPLMRLTGVRLTNTAYHLIWSYHHLLLDGWSVALLNEELITCYEAYLRGVAPQLPRRRPYRDYIGWLYRQDLSQAEAFWRRALAGFTAPTPLRIERDPAGAADTADAYAAQSLTCSTELTTALQALARQVRVTLNTLIQGAWALLLSHYSGELDVVYGATVSGRPSGLPGSEAMIGLFINTLPVRVQVAPGQALSEWLAALQAQMVAVREYEYSPLARVQSWSEVPSGLALFDSIVVFENYPGNPFVQMHNLQIFQRTNYPLTIMVEPGPALSLRIRYDSRRFEDTAVARMLEHLQVLVEGLIACPERRIGELSPLTEAERNQLLVEWNATATPFPVDVCIHHLFAAQAARTPDAVALVCGAHSLTYAELDRRANRLAQHLRARGVGPEQCVGIWMERSLELVVAILATLKAGAAYLPLDPAAPPDRLAFMLRDTHAPVLLTQQALYSARGADSAAPSIVQDSGEGHAHPHVLCLDRDWATVAQSPCVDPAIPVTPDHLAYVIYTSGSTGRPKGVLGHHRGILNRFHWMWDAYPFAPDEVGCQKTALSFVDAIWELFGPLLRGVRLLVIPDALLHDPRRFVAALEAEQVTRLVLVPSLLRALLEAAPELDRQLPRLRHWVTSGEALDAALCQRFHASLPGRVLLNLYGSSEVAADATAYQTSAAPAGPVPIGRPIANTQVYLLDTRMELVPVGVPGELYVGGVQLARGYLDRPDLTAASFRPNPFVAARGAPLGERLYRTGDLARYRADGTLEYLGRVDDQVKVRGFRIELGEVMSVLERHPAVRQAVVVGQPDVAGGTRLVAYVVLNEDSHGASVDPQTTSGAGEARASGVADDGWAAQVAELRRFLQTQLPEYMVPAAYMRLTALPLTRSGKVDRRALPAPEAQRPALEARYVAPRSELERTIAAVWQAVLQVEEVGIYDNFFELGGHSLLMVQVYSRLSKHIDADLTVVDLFKHPTISMLARHITQRAGPGATSAPAAPGAKLQAGRERLKQQQHLRRGGRAADSVAGGADEQG